MSSSPLKVVVVDDNDDMRELTQEILAAHGFDVKAAASVKAAVALIDDSVDAVLTDVRLGAGEEGGLELCQQLQERFPQISVYVFSGDGTIEDAALRSGARAFWLKPVDLVKVATTLRES